MKRVPLVAFLGALVLLHPLRSVAQEPTPVPTPRPVVFSKDAVGHVSLAFLDFTLQSNAASDQTARAIPDGSKLVSSQFSMTINDKGVGAFRGFFQLLNADGSLIATGELHGVAGMTSRRYAGADNSAPGHLEGFLESIPTVIPLPPGPQPMATPVAQNQSSFDPGVIVYPYPQPVLHVSFSADALPTASPIPTYRATFDGLVQLPPRPQPARIVTMTADKARYGADETIVATITNGLHRSIQVYDGQSYCTIVQLQIERDGGWQTTASCVMGRAPMPVAIAAGDSLKVSLPPANTVAASKPAGTYRLAIDYQRLDDNGNASGDFVNVVSPTFTVGNSIQRSVTVQASQAFYGDGDRITATIANNSKSTIRIFDEQSFCTIVQLRQRVRDGWQLVGACPMDRMPIPTYIGPGERKEVVLPPPNAAGTPPDWQTGTYDLAVTFAATTSAGETSQDYTVYSDSFFVGPPPPTVSSVTLQPDRGSYAPTEHITAVLANRTVNSIRLFAGQSFCTIIRLDQQTAGGWNPVSECELAFAPEIVIVKPGEVKQVEMPEVSTPEFAFDAGTYRLAATCTPVDDNGNPIGVNTTVFSDSFVVQPADKVTVKTDRDSYSVGDHIKVVVSNNKARAIQTYDHQSYCTIVTLQMSQYGQWKDVAECMVMTPTQIVTIDAGHSVSVVLPPETATAHFDSGLYRVQFTDNVKDNTASTPIVVYSRSFSVGSTTGTRAL